MQWDESCNIGFDAVDSRREELFDLVQTLANNNSNGNKAKILQALKNVAQYASQQFSIEEELMRDISFPAYNKHFEEHEKFKRNVAGYLSELKNGNSCSFDEVVRFLKSWINQHILGTDIEFGKFKNDCLEKEAQSYEDKRVSELRGRPIEKLHKLKHLFREKLITVEDFKHRKVKIFSEHLGVRSLELLKEGITDLEFFYKNGYLTEKEKKFVIADFLDQVDLHKSLEELKDIEGKLILLNSFYECELVEEPQYLEFKEKVLSQI
jgi:hemerythrin-like metal-binding protein